MYLSRRYGEFPWSESSAAESSLVPITKRRFLNGFVRVFAFVLPCVLLALLIWKHQHLQSIGLNVNLMAIVLIAWVLLTVDAALKLGIIASAIRLANEIRNLK